MNVYEYERHELIGCEYELHELIVRENGPRDLKLYEYIWTTVHKWCRIIMDYMNWCYVNVDSIKRRYV